MSRAVSLFDLAAELVRRHERAAADQTNVIRVLVDDLPAALPVLVSFCEVCEGRLLSTLDSELQAPVPGTADPIRRAAVRESLTSQFTADRHVDLVNQGAGFLDATFAGSTAAVASQGELEVLAVARAVVHRDLDEHRLAVIAYRENLIDLPFRRAIWSLAVDQLDGAPHRTLRTLVFVAETAIDIGLHCQTGRGFHLAVYGDRLLRRKGTDDLQAAAGQIARHERPFVLFLGAGFSASSRLPLGNTLRDAAIRRLLSIPEESVTSTDLAARFHRWVSDQGWLTPHEQHMSQEEFVRQLTLEEVIRVEQRMDSSLPTLRGFRERHDQLIKAPGPAVLHLAAVLEQAVGRIVVAEVNFDLLVETTEAPLKVFASQQDFAEAPAYVKRYLVGEEPAIPLLKLHGSIADIETCVVSTEQTEQGLGQQKLEALRVLLDPSHPRLWVYVGASLRDLDLRPVLLGEDFSRGLDERWVSPYLTESVEEFGAGRAPRWTQHTDFSTIDERLITETADAFFQALHSAWSAGATRV